MFPKFYLFFFEKNTLYLLKKLSNSLEKNRRGWEIRAQRKSKKAKHDRLTGQWGQVAARAKGHCVHNHQQAGEAGNARAEGVHEEAGDQFTEGVGDAHDDEEERSLHGPQPKWYGPVGVES